MRKIMISIALVALMLTGCSKNEGKTTAVENIATDTVATIGDASADATTEETAEEPAPEKETLEAEATTEVPATTEISGGKKTDTGKKEDTNKPSTTESTKPSTNHSNNGGSASSGQSTAPKPSNNGSNSGGNLGNSGSGNSGSGNSTPSQKPSTPATTEAPKPSTTEAPKPATTEAPTTQHQHVYDQVVVDTPEQRIDYPEQGYYAPAKRCNTCYQVFTSSDDFVAHATYGGGSCPADGYGTTQVWIKTGDPYTEVIPAKTHRECKCGARE